MAQPRHPRRHPGAVRLSGLSPERRDLGLRRRAGVRPAAARCATSSISTSAPSPAAASCSTAGSMAARPAMPARSARCRCPAPDGTPRQLIDVASIAMLEKALNAKRPRRLASVDLAGGLGRSRPGARRTGSPRPRNGARLRDRRGLLGHRLSRRRSSTAGCRLPCARGWSTAIGEALQKIDVEGLTVPPVREGTVGIHARALGGASLPLSERFLVGATAAVREG